MEKEKQLFQGIEELRTRLQEAEETLSAIRSGEVDAIVVSGPQGEQVFTLTGAEQAYRVVIETMNEGAASLNKEGMIIYCNQRLSEMIKTPLEKVIGASMRQFVRASDLPVFDGLIEKGLQKSSKGEISFIKNDGTVLPVLLFISALRRGNPNPNMCSIVVTDLTAQKQVEEELRRHRDNLEELVKVRTNELETANQQLQKEITERKQSEEKYRTLVENIPQRIFTKDKQSVYVSCNENFARELGIRPEEIAGKTDYDFFSAEFVDKYRANDMRIMESGETDNVEEQSILGGEKVWVYMTKTPLRDKEGNTVGILGVFSDITERKRLEKAEKREQALSNAIIESIPGAFYVLDENGRYVRWNTYQRDEIIGKPEDLVAGTNAVDIIYPDDWALIQSKIANVLGRGIEETVEGRVLLRGGPAFRWLLMTGRQMTIEGRPFLVGIGIDITERKLAEEALQEASEFNRQVIESVQEGIIVYGLDLKYQRWNSFMERLTGLPAAEVLGRHPLEVFPFLIEAGVIAGIEKALEGEVSEAKRFQFHIPQTGRSGWVSEIIAPLKNARGDIIGVITNLRDITEHLKLEDQLRHAQKMEAVGTLAGGIAHDFNNILNVIMGYGGMVYDSLEPGSPSKEKMNEVLTAAERAAYLTKRLLVFSRKQVVAVKPVNINELILGVQKMLVRILRENIDFKLDLEARPLIVLADSGQIEQVLMNLVTNARDVMPEGGSLTICTGLQELDDEYVAAYGYGKTGRYALITVTDTGQGMNAETQKKIFEPFFTTKGIGEGTGLGLSISYGIIKQHSGYIKVYSEPGQGTVFKIYLPLSEEAVSPDKKTAAVPTKGGNETILVAEDDASVMQLTRIVLESFGYSVITAKDGDDAIAKFMENRERISLVLLDMIMPKKNGKEVSETIRKVSPRMKILFASGYTMDIIKTDELTAAGFDFIHKPFIPKDLLIKVREVLDR